MSYHLVPATTLILLACLDSCMRISRINSIYAIDLVACCAMLYTNILIIPDHVPQAVALFSVASAFMCANTLSTSALVRAAQVIILMRIGETSDTRETHDVWRYCISIFSCVAIVAITFFNMQAWPVV